MKGEGTFEYYALLFIPSKAPFDLYYRESRHGLQLYVKRIFILDEAEQLLPPYLRFVKGVVDAEDLPLNISREILQENRQIQAIRRRLTKKIIETLSEMMRNDPEQYRSFWKEFGTLIKEGVYQDYENRESLLDLVLSQSTGVEGLTSIGQYVDRMKEGQSDIYYLTGDSYATLQSSPHLEAFKEKGYEVLLLADPVDSVWTEQTPEYRGRKLVSVAKGGVDLGTEEERRRQEERRKEAMQEHGSLLALIKEKLDAYVKEVRFGSRLTSSAACLVGDQYDMNPQLERLLRSMGQGGGVSKRIMELNPDHPIMKKMQEIYDADNADSRLGEYASLLYGQAVLAEGGELPDPAAFSRLVADLMVRAV
jgi:molecular chaperone HtpG